mgnify:CR=1 FL=1
MKTTKIGLFGFGVVGEGIYKVLAQKPQLNLEIKQIAIKQVEKERKAPAFLFTTDGDKIINDPEIEMIIELISDSEAAYDIVKKAITNGKSVVSANKQMISDHHLELIELSKKHNVSFLYEAAVCGSIPIIRNLEEYFDNDLLKSVNGIVNGSTNYILSKMLNEKNTYSKALKDAQEKGFAESNPTLDVEGIDSVHKLGIIALHAFGKKIDTNKIIRKGITSLKPFDFNYAQEKDCVIKLVSNCTSDEEGEINNIAVLPKFINKNESLGQTNNEYNGVIIESTLADKQFFYGKGAGRFPTSSAVLSDISAYKFGYKYEYKKGFKEYDLIYKGIGKFYVSYENNTHLDLEIFDSISETFKNNNQSYVIGTIKYKNLVSSEIISNPKISIISFN